MMDRKDEREIRMYMHKDSDAIDSRPQQKEQEQQLKPKILPMPNGPLYLISDMKPRVVENLQNSKGEKLSIIRGVALCRCGVSKNKPFCNGSNNKINFKR